MWPKSEFFHHLGRIMNEKSYFCITYKEDVVVVQKAE